MNDKVIRPAEEICKELRTYSKNGWFLAHDAADLIEAQAALIKKQYQEAALIGAHTAMRPGIDATNDTGENNG